MAGKGPLLLLLLLLAAAESIAQVPGYDFRKRMEVDNTQVSGSTNFTDFPILVDFTDPDLRTTANGGSVENANGYDIVFTDSDGSTLLNHQLISYDSTTGRVVTWVQIPTLQATANTTIYLYYGNASITSDQSTDATWNNGYQGAGPVILPEYHPGWQEKSDSHSILTALTTTSTTAEMPASISEMR